MKTSIWVTGVVALLIIGVWWTITQKPIADAPYSDDMSQSLPGAEDAELTGFAFMQDVIAVALPSSDEVTKERLYQTLSNRAKREVSLATISRDMALFVGIQDLPDFGVSVQDLQVSSPELMTLIVGLNYSRGGPVLRAINMVVEDGSWKVDSVEALDMYPPLNDNEMPPWSVDINETRPIDGDACFVGGCSSQICSDNPDMMSTCEWREEYACYQSATCERQADGICGWTQTESLQACRFEAQE
jgi:hypothetical protein